MKFFRKKGFTLLELLIVVVIVGILATLAVPRYFRAVEKARWAEAKSILGVLRGAQIRYKAERGSYSDDITELDTEITTGQYFTFATDDDEDAMATATRNAEQDTFTLTGNTITIDEDGEFSYTGVPAWLQ